MWTKIKEWGSACAGIITSVINIFKRIADLAPVQYFKNLADSEKSDSAHGFVNVLWGGGSFAFFWISHFIKLHADPKTSLTVVVYTFIAAMAGISTYSAIQAKKVDAGTYVASLDESKKTPPSA